MFASQHYILEAMERYQKLEEEKKQKNYCGHLAFNEIVIVLDGSCHSVRTI